MLGVPYYNPTIMYGTPKPYSNYEGPYIRSSGTLGVGLSSQITDLNPWKSGKRA